MKPDHESLLTFSERHLLRGMRARGTRRPAPSETQLNDALVSILLSAAAVESAVNLAIAKPTKTGPPVVSSVCW